jgi:hypothetical protein
MSTAPVWQRSDADLLAELGALETQMHSTWAQMLSVVAEIESRSMAPGLGYGSTVELVRAIARIPRSEARARVNAAADVLPSRGIGGAPVEPKLPTTAAAVADAAIGAADVAVIRSVLARIPPHLRADTRAEIEAELAHHARTLDAGQLGILGKRILAYFDQDGRRPNDTPETRRSLRFHERDGGYELAGWLDREAAEILRSALSPLAAPRPTTDTEIDLRTAAQRDADALVELAQRALRDGELPTEGAERPQVVVTVSLPVLQGRIGSARHRWRWVVRSTRTSPADSPVTRASSRWCWAPGVNHWMWGAPAAPSPPRSAARSFSEMADVRIRGVQYRPAGATFTTLSIGLTTGLPAWRTAWHFAVDTTDSSTIPSGESR